MKGEQRMLALWLLPAAPARQFFCDLIQRLAERFEAPVFEPHLTLHGTGFDEAHLERLDQIPMPGSVELEIDGIEFSEKYTKTLFVQFREQGELTALNRTVAEMFGDKSELNPHLSLIYQKMPNEQKAELATTIQIPFQRVSFEVIKAVVTPATIESREGVESWRTVWERSLS